MITTKCKKFQGEIRNYLINDQNNFDMKIDRLFSSLKVKTWLCRTNIIKKDGYPAFHLMFILFLLPVMKLKSINGFCNKRWYQWSESRKDAFYRFKQKPYRWRSFFYKIIVEIFKRLQFDKTRLKELYFIIDDSTLAKRGKHMENVSFIYDHSLGRSILGYCIVTLGVFTGNGYYPIDFSYWFSASRHPKSPEENIGDSRCISGQRSFEAKHYSKLDLALMMIQRAVGHGIKAGYVLFDSWYAWPVFINKIRQINKKLHVICRLKDSKTKYQYQSKKYRLSELYQKVKSSLKINKKTNLMLKRVTVKMPGSHEDAVIVFAKGYSEPEQETVKGMKKPKTPKWVAFLCTDTQLHSATIIKKYTKRWSVEVSYKECKQLLQLGKEQSQSFQAQVFATTISFLRYAILNFLNEIENKKTPGYLFETLVDDTAVITYAQRLWDFFRGLFEVSISKIFKLFEIEDDFHSYLNALDLALKESSPILGCET